MQQIAIPPTNEGETYIGAIVDASGNAHHVILLAGDNDDSDWQAAMDWAKSIGGDLPTKLEAAMLFDHAKDQFQPDWYWTNQTYVPPSDPENTAFAWWQDFLSGVQSFNIQNITTKGYYYCRARAVRRLPI